MDPAIPAPPPFPVELQPYRSTVQAYVNAKIKQFAGAFNRRLRLNLDPANLDACVQETMLSLASLETNNTRALRLVLRHDCQSTGCGETGCLLCQFNPSRLCKRNIKNKYLIDDHLKAKCGAPLRVELVDETNACVVEGLPDGMQLESHVMNGEKYKEICPENTLLSHAQLRSCIIAHHTKALLRRDGGSDEQLRCFLQLERGQAVLSDLQVTTSSEALLAGKAPTFRLLIWAVDAQGEPVPSVTYVVSEYFVVATKRVKHAIKSDIPSVSDNVSKLVHIGKATVDKLMDLRSAAAEEGFEISVPDELNRVDKVGQFQQLVELSEMNTDLKNKVRHLLKLSPEKWEEVANHAQAAVMPDFRPRAWWCPALKAGLLFSCKNGSVCMDQPIALVKMAGKGEDDQVIPIAQLDVQLFNTIPKLKAQAVQSWYAQSHPGWAIYWKDGQQDPTIQTAVLKEQEAAGHSPSINTAGPPAYSGQSAGPRRPSSTSGATAASMFAIGQPPNIPLLPPTAADPRPTSPFHFHAPAQQNQGQLLQAQPPPLSLNGGPNMQALNPGGGMNGNSKSPFAAETLMGGIQADFPAWPNQPPGAASAVPNQPGQAPQADSMNLSLMINTLAGGSMAGQAGLMGVPGALDGLQTDLDLNRGMSQFNTSFGMENPSTLWGLNTTNLPSMLAGTGSLNASLNQMMQEQAGVYPTMERAGSGEPPSKMQRTMPPEEGQAA